MRSVWQQRLELRNHCTLGCLFAATALATTHHPYTQPVSLILLPALNPVGI